MNKKITTEIAVGIILVIAIIVGVSVWVGSKKVNQPISQPPNPITQNQNINNEVVQQPQPKNESNKNVAWIHYGNMIYEYEMKYPENLSLCIVTSFGLCSHY